MELEVKLADVFEHFGGEEANVIYQYLKDMVACGEYKNNREYLLHKLEVIKIAKIKS